MVVVCLLVIALMVASTVPVGAKKPPPGDDTDPTGTIYFHYTDANDVLNIYSMNADGSSKTKEVQWADGMTSMSLKKHGDDGNYWYVGFIKVDGTHPDGIPKTELWAIRDDNGDSELLLDDDSMSYKGWNGPPVWVNGDTHLSWAALKWADATTIEEAGIYKAAITFSDGVPSMSTPDLVWSTDPYYHSGNEYYTPEVSYPSWNPDGTKAVMFSVDGRTVVDFTGVEPTDTVMSGYTTTAFWSPDGSKLAHLTDHKLYVMDPDGADDTLLVSPKSNPAKDNVFRTIRWSPDSKFLMYSNCFWSPRTWIGYADVFIIGVDGSGNTCLTRDLTTPDYIYGRDWR